MLLTALVMSLTFGQIDAGSVDVPMDAVAVDAGVSVVDAGVVVIADGGVVAVNAAALDNLVPYVELTKKHIENGDWVSALSCVLVILIGLFRMFAKKLHDFIPDDNPLDKFFYFMLETKPGGWIVNFLTTSGLGVGSFLMLGQPITWAILKPIFGLSLTMAGVWGAAKDLWEWAQPKIKAMMEKKTTPPAPPAAPGA